MHRSTEPKDAWSEAPGAQCDFLVDNRLNHRESSHSHSLLV